VIRQGMAVPAPADDAGTMSDPTNTPDDFDLQELDPDDTKEQLHPSPPAPELPDPSDDDFAGEPDYEENDG